MRKRDIVAHNMSIIAISLCLLIWVAWTGGEEALALEHSHLAWLQSMMLIACATTSINMAMLYQKHRLFWTILSGLLLYGALDERFMWHEHIQEYIYFQWLKPSALHAKWIRVTTLFYAIGGVMLLMKLRSICHATTLRWMSVAIFVACLAILLDISFDSVYIQMYEEILEYTAETLFLSGLISELHRGQNYHG